MKPIFAALFSPAEGVRGSLCNSWIISKGAFSIAHRRVRLDWFRLQLKIDDGRALRKHLNGLFKGYFIELKSVYLIFHDLLIKKGNEIFSSPSTKSRRNLLALKLKLSFLHRRQLPLRLLRCHLWRSKTPHCRRQHFVLRLLGRPRGHSVAFSHRFFVNVYSNL